LIDDLMWISGDMNNETMKNMYDAMKAGWQPISIHTDFIQREIKSEENDSVNTVTVPVIAVVLVLPTKTE